MKTLPKRTDRISQGEGRPRLGLLAGAGESARPRLEAIERSGLAEVAAIADRLDDLLGMDLDGVVCATPGALRTRQAVEALEAGLAVFCQAPLGHNALEARMVVEAAREADLLLGVDLPYRHVVGMGLVRERVRDGAIGRVFAVDLAFHSAVGPEKSWSYEARVAGGGCVMELGCHLADLALWTLDYPNIERVGSRLLAGGFPLKRRGERVEDYATARIDLEHSAMLNLACSRGFPVGRDAVIEVTFRGTEGTLTLHNLNGSLDELSAVQFKGTRREVLDQVDNAWQYRAVLAWVRRLARAKRFDPEIRQIIPVAEVLDAIYGF